MNNRARFVRPMIRPSVFEACCMCGLQCPGKFTGEARDWDWFTGHLDETVHFCPYCRCRFAEVHARLRRISLIRPVPPAHLHQLRDALKDVVVS
jgi:hypothetical protein